jgi:SRSO17 transposase
MERRFRERLNEMREEARVPASLLRDLGPRLRRFLEPFVALLRREEQRVNAHGYVQGLLSRLERKNAEAISYLLQQERQALQKFIGQSPWDHEPLMEELARQIGHCLGEPDAVLVFDPSAFPKKGTESVGVARQWCGRQGKVDNCQVAVYLGYASRQEHALADVRLYLPREWKRKRCKEAGVPRDVKFRTRHELALDMLDSRGKLLPHGWVGGDDEMGRSSAFRQELRSRGEKYLLDVPCNTLVRDLAEEEPPYSGRGRRPQVPWRRADRLAARLPAEAWQEVEVRDGEKGPVKVRLARRLVQAKEGRNPSEVAEVLVMFQEEQSDGSIKHDYALAGGEGAVGTPVAELARVFKARHRVEECIERAKGEAGLADYQVRTWEGWHHHQALALLAAWFLLEQTRRGKNADAGADGANAGADAGPGAGPHAGPGPDRAPRMGGGALAGAHRRSAALPLDAAQPLAAITV